MSYSVETPQYYNRIYICLSSDKHITVDETVRNKIVPEGINSRIYLDKLSRNDFLLVLRHHIDDIYNLLYDKTNYDNNCVRSFFNYVFKNKFVKPICLLIEKYYPKLSIIDFKNCNGSTFFHEKKYKANNLVRYWPLNRINLFHYKDNDGDTVIHLYDYSDEDIILLRDHFIKHGKIGKICPFTVKNNDGNTILHVNEFPVSYIKTLINQYGFSILAIKNNMGLTPVQIYAYFDIFLDKNYSTEKKELLLSKDKYKDPLLFSCCKNLDDDNILAKICIAHDINPFNIFDGTGLNVLSRYGYSHTIVDKLAKHFKTNPFTTSSETNNKEQMVSYLLDIKGNNYQFNNYRTTNYISIFYTKLKNLYDIDTFYYLMDKNNNTLFHCDEINIHYVIDIAYSNKINLFDIKNISGNTVFHIHDISYDRLINYAKRFKQNIYNSVNNNGDTIFHLFDGDFCHSLLSDALKNKINLLEIRNKNGDTIFHKTKSIISLVIALANKFNQNLFDIVNNDGDTIFHMFPKGNEKLIIDYAIKTNINPFLIKNKDGDSVFCKTYFDHNLIIKAVKYFKQNIFDIVNNSNNTIYHILGYRGEDIIEMLELYPTNLFKLCNDRGETIFRNDNIKNIDLIKYLYDRYKHNLYYIFRYYVLFEKIKYSELEKIVRDDYTKYKLIRVAFDGSF
jgi:hypothetical protein